MKTSWIALFRGINVGGKNKMPMASLKATMKLIGCEQVQTYIQSGNVVFESSQKSRKTLQSKLLNAVEENFGFRADLILLTKSELSEAIESNPFSAATAEPKSLHFFFLSKPPGEPDLDAIKGMLDESESCMLIGSVFYLHAPNGISRSKVAAGVERKLGVAATARNYNTVAKLWELINTDSTDR